MDTQEKLLDVKKIAILRANALGDFIVTLPAIKALKNAYPNAEIILLGKPWHKEFLVKGRTPVDRVIVVPVKQGIRSETMLQKMKLKFQSFITKMQEEEFDVVINMQGSGKSANPFIKSFQSKNNCWFMDQRAERLDYNLDLLLLSKRSIALPGVGEINWCYYTRCRTCNKCFT